MSLLRALAAPVLLASLALAMPASAEGAKGFDKKGFDAGLALAKANQPGADYGWLRQQNLLRNDYALPDWDEQDKAFDALDSEPETALKLARAQFEVNYFDMYPHVAAEQALNKLGQVDAAENEHITVLAILNSIMGDKDGHSAAQAFKVVSVHEEYQTLSLLGLKPQEQALSTIDGHAYDVMDTIDSDTSEKVKIWFQIDSFFGKEF
jgi:hypothetical protein